MKFRVVRSYLDRFGGLVKLPPRIVREVSDFIKSVYADESFKYGYRKQKFVMYQAEVPYEQAKLKENPFEFWCIVEYSTENEAGWQSGNTIVINKRVEDLRSALSSTLDHELIHLLQDKTVVPRPNRAINQKNFINQGLGGRYKTKWRDSGNSDDDYYQGEVEYQPHILSLSRGCIDYIEDRGVNDREGILDLIKHYFNSSKFLNALKKEPDQRRYKNAYKKAYTEVVSHFEKKWVDTKIQDRALAAFKSYTKYKDDAKLESIASSLEMVDGEYLNKLAIQYPNWVVLRFIKNYNVSNRVMNRLRPITKEDVNAYGRYYEFIDMEFEPPLTKEEIRAIVQSDSRPNLTALKETGHEHMKQEMLNRAKTDQKFLLTHIAEFTSDEVESMFKQVPSLRVIKDLSGLDDIPDLKLTNFIVSDSATNSTKLSFYYLQNNDAKFFDVLLKTPDKLLTVAKGNNPTPFHEFYRGDFGSNVRNRLASHILRYYRMDKELQKDLRDLSESEMKDLVRYDLFMQEHFGSNLLVRRLAPLELINSLSSNKLSTKEKLISGTRGEALEMAQVGIVMCLDLRKVNQDLKPEEDRGVFTFKDATIDSLDKYISYIFISQDAIEALKQQEAKEAKKAKLIESLLRAKPTQRKHIYIQSLSDKEYERRYGEIDDDELDEQIQDSVERLLQNAAERPLVFGGAQEKVIRKILDHPKLQIVDQN